MLPSGGRLLAVERAVVFFLGELSQDHALFRLREENVKRAEGGTPMFSSVGPRDCEAS
jgi:hypothetical protein